MFYFILYFKKMTLFYLIKLSEIPFVHKHVCILKIRLSSSGGGQIWILEHRQKIARNATDCSFEMTHFYCQCTCDMKYAKRIYDFMQLFTIKCSGNSDEMSENLCELAKWKLLNGIQYIIQIASKLNPKYFIILK